MGLMRVLGRAGTLAVAGAAAGYFLRRRGALGAQPPGLQQATAPPPPEPVFVPQPPEPDLPVEPEIDEEPELVVEEATVEWDADDVEEAVGEVIEPPPDADEAPDVTAVVDDLLGGREGSVADAEVVSPQDDARLAEAVRIALAEEPGLLSGPVDIEVEDGRVTLRGELQRLDGIVAVERRAQRVEGLRELRSYLQLAGTPGPDER